MSTNFSYMSSFNSLLYRLKYKIILSLYVHKKAECGYLWQITTIRRGSMESGPIEALQAVLQDNQRLQTENAALRVLFTKISSLVASFVEGTSQPERQAAEAFTLGIDVLQLPDKAFDALVARGDIRTIADLAQKTEKDLLGTYNFGRHGLYKVRKALSKFGLEPGMTEQQILTAKKPEPEAEVEE